MGVSHPTPRMLRTTSSKITYSHSIASRVITMQSIKIPICLAPLPCGGSVHSTTSCGAARVIHLHAFFDFFIVSRNISAAATSKANKMLATARFIVGHSFPLTRFLFPS